jgi:hypothetical protein
MIWSPDGAEEHELFAWLRGPYRNLGIGHSCVEQLAPVVLTRLPEVQPRPYLRVRYPGAGRVGGAHRLQQEMWLAFFYQYGFRPVPRRERPNPDDLVLRRRLDGAPGTNSTSASRGLTPPDHASSGG